MQDHTHSYQILQHNTSESMLTYIECLKKKCSAAPLHKGTPQASESFSPAPFFVLFFKQTQQKPGLALLICVLTLWDHQCTCEWTSTENKIFNECAVRLHVGVLHLQLSLNFEVMWNIFVYSGHFKAAIIRNDNVLALILPWAKIIIICKISFN